MIPWHFSKMEKMRQKTEIKKRREREIIFETLGMSSPPPPIYLFHFLNYGKSNPWNPNK